MRVVGLVLVVLAVAAAGCMDSRGGARSDSAAASPSGADPALRSEIDAMMAASAGAWNRGDLDEFMQDFAERATFVASRGVLHGREEIREVYAPRFAPGGVRDSLSFERTEVHPLAPGLAHVISHYRLVRGDSTVALGPTSLVMRREGERWRIAHDHSS